MPASYVGRPVDQVYVRELAQSTSETDKQPPLKLYVVNEYPIFVAKGNSTSNGERLRHTEIDIQSAEHTRISASITSSWTGSSGNTLESV